MGVNFSVLIPEPDNLDLEQIANWRIANWGTSSAGFDVEMPQPGVYRFTTNWQAPTKPVAIANRQVCFVKSVAKTFVAIAVALTFPTPLILHSEEKI